MNIGFDGLVKLTRNKYLLYLALFFVVMFAPKNVFGSGHIIVSPPIVSDAPSFSSFPIYIDPTDGFARVIYYDSGIAGFTRCLDQDCVARNTITIGAVSSSSGYGWFSDIFIDPVDGFARMAYRSNFGQLTFARCLDLDCTDKNTNLIGGLTMTMGADGFARFLHRKPSGGGNFKRCLDNDCIGQQDTDIPDMYGSFTHPPVVSIAISPIDNLPRLNYSHASSPIGSAPYYSSYSRCLDQDCVARNTITIGAVSSSGSDWFSDIFIDPVDGFARMAYRSNFGQLTFVRCLDLDCTDKNTNPIGGSSAGYGASMTMGADGFARFTYKDTQKRFARCLDADCAGVVETPLSVITDPLISWYPSLAMGIDGFPRISYGQNFGNLVIARCTNIDCAVAAVPSPTVSSIAPASGVQGTTFPAVISGANLSGATSVIFSGTGVSAVIVGTPTANNININITIGALATLGARTVTVTTPGGTGTTSFNVTAAAAPAVSSINPASGVNTGTVSIASVSGTNFVSGATVRLTKSGEPNINCSGFTFTNSTTLSNGSCPINGVATGAWNVVVTNPDAQFGTFVNGFNVTAAAASACVGGNVIGWAWSSNIGWISFSCANPEAPSATDFGVSVSPMTGTGNFSGYAMYDADDPSTPENEGAGWINFAPAGPYPDDPPHSARINWTSATSGTVTGWARACAGYASPTSCSGASNTDGFDGWIKMSGATFHASAPKNEDSQFFASLGRFGAVMKNILVSAREFLSSKIALAAHEFFGVSLSVDTTSGKSKFSGYAWGSNVIGWIQFDPAGGGVFIGGTPPAPNTPPTAVITGPSSALVGNPVIFNGGNSGDDEDGFIIDGNYEWKSGVGCGSNELDTDSILQKIYSSAGSYNVCLRVRDSQMVWSTQVIKTIVISQPQCSDGIDNEAVPDGLIDWKSDGTGDPDCISPLDNNESPTSGPVCNRDGICNKVDGETIFSCPADCFRIREF